MDVFIWKFEDCETGREAGQRAIKGINTIAYAEAGLGSRRAEGL